MITHDMKKIDLATLEADFQRTMDEQDARQKRINSCEMENTDACLSMWAASSTEGKKRVQMDLARNGWKWTFKVLHKDGKPVVGRVVDTKFGTRWVIDGKFLPCYGTEETGRRASNFAKLGFSWVEMELDAHVGQTFGSYLGAPVHAFPVADNKDLIVI